MIRAGCWVRNPQGSTLLVVRVHPATKDGVTPVELAGHPALVDADYLTVVSGPEVSYRKPKGQLNMFEGVNP